jgi:hypothetical protein
VDIAPVFSFCFKSLILELSLLSFSWSARIRSYVDTLFLISFEYMIVQVDNKQAENMCVHTVSVPLEDVPGMITVLKCRALVTW